MGSRASETPAESLAKARAVVRARLAGFKTPKQVVFCDLPKTSTGKIQKFELRAAAKLHKPLAGWVPAGWLRPYTPDFRKAFDFFCIHTGGRGIIDGLEKEMALTRAQVEPSRASLYRYGNTSSTSVW